MYSRNLQLEENSFLKSTLIPLRLPQTRLPLLKLQSDMVLCILKRNDTLAESPLGFRGAGTKGAH